MGLSVKVIKNSLKHSITRRLLTVVFSVYLILTTIITLTHMYVEFLTVHSGIERELQRFDKIIRGGLVEALWNYDIDQVRVILAGALNSTIIKGAKVSTTLGEELSWQAGYVENASGQTVYVDGKTKDTTPVTGLSAHLISHAEPMKYVDLDRKEFLIGQITLYSNNAVVFDQVKIGYLLIIINAFVKTISLWIFFLWAGFVYISRPLASLTNAIQSLSFDESKLLKVALVQKQAEGTEIETLGNAFNAMVEKLNVSNLELNRTQKRLESVINTMPSVLIGVSDQGIVSDWNSKAEMVSGVLAKDAIGKSVVSIYPPFGKYMPDVTESIEKQEFRKSNKIKEKINSEWYYFNVIIYPVITRDYAGAVILIEDVTSQVNLEETVKQSEKMSSIGGLAAGVAHEINNPLGAIVQAGQNILRRVDKNLPGNIKAAEELGVNLQQVYNYLEKRQILEFIEGIRDAGAKAASIVSDLLQFTKHGKEDKNFVNFADLVDKAIDLTASDYLLKKLDINFTDIKIQKLYAAPLREVYCSKMEMEQAIINILKNAAYYKQTKSDLQIVIQLRESGDFMELIIEDNGPGMDEKVRKKIFEPFFSTKPVGRGSGLGLAVTYSIIVDDHSGSIFVESTPSVGTRFIISLPIENKENHISVEKNQNDTSRGTKH